MADALPLVIGRSSSSGDFDLAARRTTKRRCVRSLSNKLGLSSLRSRRSGISSRNGDGCWSW